MWVKLKNYKTITLVVVSIVMCATIAFSERERKDDRCHDVIIYIDNQYENFFIDEGDVLDLMTENGTHVIKGTSFEELNLKMIEERVKKERFIKNAEIFKDIKGNIIVNAELRRPFARIVQPNGPGAFIALDGAILPISSKYTTRTMLISGEYAAGLVKNDLTETEEGRKLFDLLTFIHQDKFWKAQVAELDINKKMDITIYPQVTKQVVEFGKAENIEDKFKRLKTFYKQILPRKGWNVYSRVNLKYKDQIIAE